MKKALQISIAGTLFTFEEDAYMRLEGYFASIKEHFRNTEGKEEIISDIESRVAEQLIESKEKIVTISTVEKVISIMGKVEDFGDEEVVGENKQSKEEEKTGIKKLYRDPDDAIIAGVCSGLAAYMGIDPVWVRLFFVLLTLGSGLGVLLYIVLWLIMPEAKTASHKLEMRGNPVTLETLSETVKTMVEEVKKKDNKFLRIISLPFNILGRIIRFFVRIVGPVARVAVGLSLAIVSMIAIAGVVTLSGFLFSGGVEVAGLFIQDLLPGSLRLLVLSGVAVSALIPLLFVFFGGISVLRKKSVVSWPVSLAMLGIWFISLVVSGFGAAKMISGYEIYNQNSPEAQTIILPIDIAEPFDKLEVSKGVSVEIVSGPTTSLVAEGKQGNMDSIDVAVKNGTLLISQKSLDRGELCIFCLNETPKFTLTAPSLSKIDIKRGSSMKSESLPGAAGLDLNIDSGSYVDMSTIIDSLNVTMSDGSNLTLEGSAKNLNVYLDYGSNLSARKFKVQTAKIEAQNGSNAEISASDKLEATAQYGSNISYASSPTLIVIKSEKTGSSVHSE